MSKNYHKSNKDYKNKTRRKEEYGDLSYGFQGKPEGDNVPSTGINTKALRDLPKSSYSVKADPYISALPGSEPYAIINKFNKTIGGFYGGDRNIDGGNVQQYANSLTSKMLHAFDFARLPMGINYQYIETKGINNPSGPYATKALIDEQIRAIAEATSTLQSTTFTQMAINRYKVATTMPGGSKYDPKKMYTKGSAQIPLYDDINSVLYMALRWYQIFWLKTLGVFDWHNSFRLKMGTMIRSSWNRETPELNSLFGLFKKKSFIALLNSLAMSFPGEYLDREFALQFAKTCLIPSRRANALTEAVLETQVEYNMPEQFILLIDDGDGNLTPVFDAAEDLATTVNGETTNYEQAVHKFMTMLSAEDTMAWARKANKAADNNDAARFNTVKRQLDVIQRAVTKVKTQFTDVREVLDTCVRAGIVTWYKGFRPSVVKDDDADLFRNLIVDDIYRMTMSGDTQVKLDSDTKRFRTSTMWNMYDGIAEFDVWSGGAFLTFSLKNVIAEDDPDNLITYMPKALTYLDTTDQAPTAYFVNRIGTEYPVTTTNCQLSSYMGTRRLVPLNSQDNIQYRIATINPGASPTPSQATDYSFLARTLIQLGGMVLVDFAQQTIMQDPDLLAIYQIEIEDITNEMIAYARLNAPFKGAVNTKGVIGFLGTVRAGSKTTLTDVKEGA